MIDSLMDKKMTQEFDRVAREKAKVCQKEQKAVEHFLQNNSRYFLWGIFLLANFNSYGFIIA